MGTITLDNVRATSDITMRVRLKDSGTAIDWSALTDIKAWLYSDAQKAISGRCDVSLDQEDGTVLICEYSGQKPQYLGVNKIIVQANYMERLKTYDKPALNIVRWTDEVDDQEVVLVDPVVNVEIEVTDVSSSVLDNAIAAAVAAAERAEEAAAAAEHMVDIHQGPPGPSGISPIIGQNGNWWTWDDELEEYVDSGEPSRGTQGVPGPTPDISIGTVTTGEPGDPAEASMTGTPEAPVLNMTIPQGPKGDDGVGLDSVSTPATPDGTAVMHLSDGNTVTLDLNHNHNSAATTLPSGGFLPDVVYSLGTLTGAVTFALAAAVTGNINHYFWMFDTSSTAPTVTWPSGITWAAGAAPTVAASKHYEISILGGIAYYSEV